MKKIYVMHTIICVILMTFFLTGCDVMSISVFSKQNKTNHESSRESKVWSGLSINKITVGENESKDIIFDINLEEGSVSFIVCNSDGEELYTLTKEAAGSTIDVYTLEEAGVYTIKEKGSKFSGKFVYSWGDSEKETENNENK